MRTCDDCKKYIIHGGKCQGANKTLISPCLMFEEDERGYVTTKTLQIELRFGVSIPPLRTFDNDWEYNNSPVKFYGIEPVKWDMKRGLLICEAQADVFNPRKHEEDQDIETTIIKFGGVK
jgi:hypothetical protein